MYELADSGVHTCRYRICWASGSTKFSILVAGDGLAAVLGCQEVEFLLLLTEQPGVSVDLGGTLCFASTHQLHAIGREVMNSFSDGGGAGVAGNEALPAPSALLLRHIRCERSMHVVLPNTQSGVSPAVRLPHRPQAGRRSTGMCSRSCAEPPADQHLACMCHQRYHCGGGCALALAARCFVSWSGRGW
jgi:hypothetical protein